MLIKFYTDDYMININSDCIPTKGDEVKLEHYDLPLKVSRLVWCLQDKKIEPCVAIFFEDHRQEI